jgi:hypothetical protein
MKLGRILVIFLTLVLFFSSTLSVADSASSVVKNQNNATGPDPAQPEDVEYYAVIVGVERFVDPKLNETVFEDDKIDDEAIAIRELLLASENWKNENIKIMLNENATKDKIQDAIVNWLGEKEDQNDVVLIYYADHGWKIPLRQRRYGHAAVFTYNVTSEARLEDKITDKEFDSWVDTLDSKNIAIIIDTCYSGKMLSLRQQGRTILTAGGKYFFCGVDEDDTLGTGIFGYFIIQGFKGIADLNNDGWVSAEEVFRYAKMPTIHFSIWKQFPFIIKAHNQTMIWFFQIPRMYDRHFGDIKLVQYQSTKE